MARDRGIVVVTSAGNEGNTSWRYVTPPADVNGVLTVGAITSAGSKTNFSSIGPTSDGRIKPDVVALGQGTAVIEANGVVGTANGTSLAAPLITSLVAGLLEAFPQLTPSELVQTIKLSSSQGNFPDNLLGYGIPHYRAVKNYLEANQTGYAVYAYPNPARDILTLEFMDLPSELVDITVYDAQGRFRSNLVSYVTWQHNPLEFSISSLPAGYYFLRIKTGDVNTTIRFVKL